MEQLESQGITYQTTTPSDDWWKDQQKDRLTIPPDNILKRLILCTWHSSPAGGHLGRDETTRQITNQYHWVGAKDWIADYIRGCATCQQYKNLTHKLKTPIYRIPVPASPAPFKQIALDLITGLPKSNDYDAILTIVDHGCSRAAIFLPCRTTITGPQIASLYLRHVYCWYGLPHKVISDRDPRFTSHFGRALTKELGIQQNISTAFHPQTDGLTERTNQWVEQYLRLITGNQEDWSNWLAVATVVHNNARNSSTGYSPNQLLIGLEPDLIPEQAGSGNNHLAEEQSRLLHERRVMAAHAINKMANSLGTPETRWKVGQKVWLEAKNLPLPYGTIKLAPKRHGPFQITRVISPVAYQLQLPHQWNIHPVFHASLLTPYIETDSHGPNYSRPPPDLISGEAEYEVEQIRSHRRHGRRKQLQYLLKWKGYLESDNTWEPADQVHAPDLIKAYHQRHRLEHIKASTTAPVPSTHSSPSWSRSFAPYYAPPPTPPINSQSLNPAPDLTSPTSTPFNTTSSAANATASPMTNTKRWSP